MAKSGDVAYEWGTGKMAHKDKKGKVTETTFKSLTVWKKQADGSWKIAVEARPGPERRGKVATCRNDWVFSADGKAVSGKSECEQNGLRWTAFAVKGKCAGQPDLARGEGDWR